MAAASSIQFALNSVTVLSSGMAVAFPAVALPVLENSGTDLTAYEASLVVGALFMASFLGILAGSMLVDKWGRRKCLLISSVQSIVGWLIVGMSESQPALLVGLMSIGAGAGFGNSCTTVYLAEIASKHWQRFIQIAKNCCFFIGVTLIYGLGYAFRDDWKKISLITSGISIVNFVLGILFLKESSLWIQQHEQREHNRTEKNMSNWRTYQQFRVAVSERKDVCKPLYMSNAIAVLRQLSGSVVFNTYAISVVRHVVNGADAYGVALAIGVSNIVGALSANAISKSCGIRRTLTYSGTIMSFSTLVLAKLQEISGVRSVDCPPLTAEIFLVVITVASTIFAVITQDLQDELFPTDYRRICSSICACNATLASWVAVVAYPTIAACWGFDNFLTLSASASVSCAIITIMMFPEMSEEEIDKQKKILEETESSEKDQNLQVLTPLQSSNENECTLDPEENDFDKITVDPPAK